MQQRSPLAPRWIAIGLILCLGLGAVGIWRRSTDPVFETASAHAARVVAVPLAGEILRDLAGARSAATWPIAWRGKP